MSISRTRSPPPLNKILFHTQKVRSIYITNSKNQMPHSEREKKKYLKTRLVKFFSFSTIVQKKKNYRLQHKKKILVPLNLFANKNLNTENKVLKRNICFLQM